jgi:hypothetical protein
MPVSFVEPHKLESGFHAYGLSSLILVVKRSLRDLGGVIPNTCPGI